MFVKNRNFDQKYVSKKLIASGIWFFFWGGGGGDIVWTFFFPEYFSKMGICILLR